MSERRVIMPGPMPPPPPPYPMDAPIQRFRDAVKDAANMLLSETGICPATVKMTWSEAKTGGRYLQSMTVGFAEDQLDGYDLIMPYYQTTDADGGDPPQL